jgi:hypothetical protein
MRFFRKDFDVFLHIMFVTWQDRLISSGSQYNIWTLREILHIYSIVREVFRKPYTELFQCIFWILIRHLVCVQRYTNIGTKKIRATSKHGICSCANSFREMLQSVVIFQWQLNSKHFMLMSQFDSLSHSSRVLCLSVCTVTKHIVRHSLKENTHDRHTHKKKTLFILNPYFPI